MCDFSPGDEVVFIGPDGIEPAPFQRGQKRYCLLTEGAVYTFHSVLHEERWGDIFGIHLREVDCPNRHGFDTRMFRKVQRRDWSVWLSAKNAIENPNPVKRPAHEPA